MNLKTIVVLILVPVLTQVSFAQTKTLTEALPEAGGFSGKRLALLDSGMNNWVKKNWVNGSVALVARKGKIVFYKAYGYNNPDTKEPLSKTGIFRVASQTKAITTVAAMMLWEEGKFSLDDPVSKYIPSFAKQTVVNTFNLKDTTYTTVPANRPITIRDVLSHTTGMGYPGIGTAEANAMYTKNLVTGGVGVKEPLTLAATMNQLGTIPLLFQPGTKWMYSISTDLRG